MGWSFIDNELERLRDELGADPDGASRRIEELLGTTKSPSSRVRLWGLMIRVCRRLGDPERGLHAYREGLRLRGSALATAELEWQVAELHIVREDRAAARTAAERSVGLARPGALRAPVGRGVHAVFPRATYAAALIARSQVRAYLEGDPRGALADAVESLRWADPRYAPRVHLSAVSAVSYLLTVPRVGAPDDLRAALQLADEAQKLLRRRRVPARHPHRIKLRWISAVAMARLGAGELAEKILSRVVAELREQGLEHDAELAAEQLLWVVAERGGKTGRARLLRRQLGLPPAPPKPPAKPESGDPIGF